MGQKQSTEALNQNKQSLNSSFNSVVPEVPSVKRQKEASNAGPSYVVEDASSKQNPVVNTSETTDKIKMKMSLPSFVVPVTSHALYDPIRDAMETSRQSVEILPESVRKSMTLNEFSTVCSEILPSFLYIGNEQVARSYSVLKEVGITHIINCCPEACGGQIDYSTCPQPIQDVLILTLRDGVMEDLIPFFWQVIEFIENASTSSSSPSKVLIHCHQGISRSCALGIAYVMYKQKLKFHDAMAFVKSKRSICSPNSAFLCQLIEFEKELTQVSQDKTNVWNIYRLAPHAPYDPKTFVLKPCYESVQSRTRQKAILSTSFHSKGCFVVFNPLVLDDLIYIWLGKDCVVTNAQEQSILQALRLIKYKQKYKENNTKDLNQIQVVIEKQGEESQEAKARANLPIEFQVQDTNLHGYETEFEWVTASIPLVVVSAAEIAAVTVTTEPEPSVSVVIAEVDEKKPLVYLLDQDQNEWEQLRRYDSDDLVCDCILLVFVASRTSKHFLWIGNECKNGVDKLKQKAIEWIHQVSSTSSTTNTKFSTTIDIVYQYEETEDFWETFELGYDDE